VQPASIDLTLGNDFIVNGARYALSASCPIAPREFLLGTTVERVKVPNGYVAKVEGRSTWARKGLVIENAGIVDPGFQGQLTLEMYNLSPDTLYLPLGERICQIMFMRMTSAAVRPYGSPGLGSHYQNQKGATEAWRN
jgi:dCTP deaminase